MADEEKRLEVTIKIIEEKLGKAEAVVSSECCIYRVPYDIRKLDSDAYTPSVVSIGPFHYKNNARLGNMQSQKLIYCKKFMERAETTLHNLVRCLQQLEPSIRRSYSEKIELRTEEFLELILIDSGFIIELFIADAFPKEWTHDFIQFNSWLESSVTSDLLLLENQVPFFVLEKLYNLAFPQRIHAHVYPSFVNLSLHYFKEYNKQGILPSNVTTVKHFTDLLRLFYLPPLDCRPPRIEKLPEDVYSATQLDEAGVKFRMIGTGSENGRNILEVRFSRGRYVEIGELTVEDDTEILFRNMMALEQCHYCEESYVTDYVVVLDNLINTDKDVDILVRNKIIINMLGDSWAVANMLNDICKNILHSNFNRDYVQVCNELKAFCERPWNSGKATLRRDYCSTPWHTVASLAAIFLLILTLIQTLCSILQL